MSLSPAEWSLYERAAERGSGSAMGWLVLDLLERDPERAKGWQERLIATGDDWEIRQLGEALRRSDLEQAKVLSEAFTSALGQTS